LRLTEITPHSFRDLSPAPVSFSLGWNLLAGDNAQGKAGASVGKEELDAWTEETAVAGTAVRRQRGEALTEWRVSGATSEGRWTGNT
jgi:recombinational DNA repair ATPase RecF